jgi:thymidine phosphorylase
MSPEVPSLPSTLASCNHDLMKITLALAALILVTNAQAADRMVSVAAARSCFREAAAMIALANMASVARSYEEFVEQTEELRDSAPRERGGLQPLTQTGLELAQQARQDRR